MRWIDGLDDSTRNLLTPSLVVVVVVCCCCCCCAPPRISSTRAASTSVDASGRHRPPSSSRGAAVCVANENYSSTKIRPNDHGRRINASDRSRPRTNASHDLHIFIHVHRTTPSRVRYNSSKHAYASVCVPTRTPVYVPTDHRS